MAKESANKLKIGDKLADGTIFAGISPDTNKPMYVTAKDANLTMTFNAAKKYASKLTAHGHKDFRVPSEAELNVLFQNRKKGALKGTFNLKGKFSLTGSIPDACYYWSSTPGSDGGAWIQRFGDGEQCNAFKDSTYSVRCVRG